MIFSLIALSSRYPIAKTLKRVAAWFEGRHDHTLVTTDVIRLYLSESNLSCVQIYESEELAIQSSDVVISVGGDGTLLRTARLVAGLDKPILGINSGKLGFLANIPMEDIETALDFTSSGRYEVDNRMMLEATTSDGNKHYALNEFLFSKGNSGSMIRLTAWYDDLLINRYWADGIIIATPTGSTAYNMSCGGPILVPSSDAIVLNPINPHTLTTRPLVLPSIKALTIRAEPANQDVIFSKDGEICDITGAETEAIIRRSEHTIDLIKRPGQTYFDTLRNKLMWGLDIRDSFTNT
jgi:NAD+ kinase